MLYVFKQKPIQVTSESISVDTEPISASESTYDDVRSNIGNDYIETDQYIEVGSHPKVSSTKASQLLYILIYSCMCIL